VSNYQLSINNYQLPEGYKQTEVGMIPEDWEVSSVGQEFEIQLGKMLDAEKNTGILKPYIGNRAVQWGYFDVSDLSYMAMSRSDLEKFRLEVGDLIVCEGGEVGRSAIWDAPIEECYYQKALHRLRVKNNFNSQLMVAFLKYWTDFDLLSNYVSQTSIAHLTKEKFSQVPLPIPSTKEQRAIAATLSDVDALIAALDKLIAKQRHLKTATMQQLLTGKKRLPGFGEGKGYKQTEVGVIPEDWEVKRLSEIGAKFLNGGTPSTKNVEYWSGEIPWITGADIVGQEVMEIRRFITSDAIKNSATNLIEQGNLLIVTRTGVGKLAISPFNVAISQDLTGVYLDADQALPQFIFSYFDYYSDILRSLNQGTSIAGITREVLLSAEVVLPSLEEQRAIATVLSDMDAAIAALEARRAKTQAIKQGMMQELLTGKTRLV